MKAIFLTGYGSASDSFEIGETTTPSPGDHQVLIEVQGFGLNYADVMARRGLYKAAPPLPAVLGYDVVGVIRKCGAQVSNYKSGDRVTAFTRFGGYAEYVCADQAAISRIEDDVDVGVGVAFTTQYCTAYYLAYNMANLQKGDHVLIHAAAGGVGQALVEMALHKGCIVFGVCSTEEKIQYLRKLGVQHPINRKKEDFAQVVRKKLPNSKLDVVFDPVGGKTLKEGFGLLGAGGRIYSFGASSMMGAKGMLAKMKILFQFGFYHPVKLLGGSKGIIGVNMLTLADKRPAKISQVLNGVVSLHKQGIIDPYVGGYFKADQIGEAHALLESGNSMGKLVVRW